MILRGEPRRVLQLMSDRRQWFGKQLVERDPEIDPDNIYVTLPRLVKQGLIEVDHWEQREGTHGLGVKLYCITDVGIQVLRATQAVEEKMRQEEARKKRKASAATAGGRT